MAKLRDIRESRALKHLTRHGVASASELGMAAVQGEGARARKIFKERLGLIIGMRFVRRGMARITRENRFQRVPPAA